MSDKPFIEHLRFRIARDCEVIISFYGASVTQEGIDLLLRTIELAKDCYPKAGEPQPFDLDSPRPTTEADGVIG